MAEETALSYNTRTVVRVVKGLCVTRDLGIAVIRELQSSLMLDLLILKNVIRDSGRKYS